MSLYCFSKPSEFAAGHGWVRRMFKPQTARMRERARETRVLKRQTARMRASSVQSCSSMLGQVLLSGSDSVHNSPQAAAEVCPISPLVPRLGPHGVQAANPRVSLYVSCGHAVQKAPFKKKPALHTAVKQQHNSDLFDTFVPSWCFSSVPHKNV